MESIFTLTGAFDSVSNTDGLAVGEFGAHFNALTFVGIIFKMRHGKSGLFSCECLNEDE